MVLVLGLWFGFGLRFGFGFGLSLANPNPNPNAEHKRRTRKVQRDERPQAAHRRAASRPRHRAEADPLETSTAPG